MIKRLSVSIFLFLCSCKGAKWDSQTLETLLNDFERHSYYVDVRIKEKDTIGRYIIPNNDLYYYFTTKHGFDDKQYVAYMMPVLLNDQVMEIDSLSLIAFEFTRIGEKCSGIKGDTEKILDEYFHKVSTNAR